MKSETKHQIPLSTSRKRRTFFAFNITTAENDVLNVLKMHPNSFSST
eukprot:UN03510